MKIPLTVLNLLHQRFRTFVALAGVAFAVLLVFMQLGFLASAQSAAVILLDKFDFDAAIVSADYMEVSRASSFPRPRLDQALAVPGVERVAPVYVSGNLWRIIADDAQRRGRRRSIMVVGFDLNNHVLCDHDINRQLDVLKVDGSLLIDTQTRKYFGERDVKVETDLGAGRIRVAGKFTIGTGYGADGLVVMSDRTFSQVFGGYPLDSVSLGLIKFAPGACAEDVAEALRRLQMANDEIRVLTRRQLLEKETRFWVEKTAVGKIFSFGVVVALVVGMVFVYQVLSSDIANRYPEYATLKAMGYPRSYLSWLVVQQAILYAVIGYVPGLVLAYGLYWLAATSIGLPIWMTAGRAVVVFLLALTMCVASGLLAMRKVQTADPADLF